MTISKFSVIGSENIHIWDIKAHPGMRRKILKRQYNLVSTFPGEDYIRKRGRIGEVTINCQMKFLN